jgi:hypothetical protein
MSIIKARTRGKQFVPYRTRLDRENEETLYAYAAFINEDVEYVLNQLIENILEKDRDFAAWRADHRQSYAPHRLLKKPRTSQVAVTSVTPPFPTVSRLRHATTSDESQVDR